MQIILILFLLIFIVTFFDNNNCQFVLAIKFDFNEGYQLHRMAKRKQKASPQQNMKVNSKLMGITGEDAQTAVTTRYLINPLRDLLTHRQQVRHKERTEPVRRSGSSLLSTPWSIPPLLFDSTEKSQRQSRAMRHLGSEPHR